MIETLVFQRLAASPVNDLCGGTGGTFSFAFSTAFDTVTPGRLFPVAPTVDADAVPFVVYTITSSKPMITLNSSAGFSEYGFTVESYASDMDTAVSVAQAVKSAFHLWHDAPVQLCQLTNAQARELAAGTFFGYSYNLDFDIAISETQ